MPCPRCRDRGDAIDEARPRKGQRATWDSNSKEAALPCCQVRTRRGGGARWPGGQGGRARHPRPREWDFGEFPWHAWWRVSRPPGTRWGPSPCGGGARGPGSRTLSNFEGGVSPHPGDPSRPGRGTGVLGGTGGRRARRSQRVTFLQCCLTGASAPRY